MFSKQNIIATAIYSLIVLGASGISYTVGTHTQAKIDNSECSDALEFTNQRADWECKAAIYSTIQACGAACVGVCEEEVEEACGNSALKVVPKSL